MILPPGLRGTDAAQLRCDVLAGATLAAVAVPESMATARLGHFAPEYGLLAFVLASVGFALVGHSRNLSAGPDSTITPIFAGALAALGATGAALAPALAIGVGLVLLMCGIARLGWLANLLSRPVLTGFLAGIAAHIVLSQAPTLLGVSVVGETSGARLLGLAHALAQARVAPFVLGLTVLVVAALGERRWPRAPWLLVGVASATLLAAALGPQASIALLGPIARALPQPRLPPFESADLWPLVSLTLVVGALVLMQTCVVSRSFEDGRADTRRGENRDLIGMGAANLIAGLFGVFPVNASPPRTAIVAEAGGRSQLASLAAAGTVVAVVLGAPAVLARIPQAALAGVLMHVAIRLVRRGVILDVARRSTGEFMLLAATACAVVFLPIQIGVAIGIALSLAHGLWSVSRAEVVGFAPVPGTTIWWPRQAPQSQTDQPDVHVIGFQAPLSFLNAEIFVAGVRAELARRAQRPRLLVIEAGSIATIDYSAASALAALIAECRARGIDVAVARLESLRAQAQFERTGLSALLGADHIHHSVAEAIAARSVR